jgi:hypothetical protein
VRAIPGGAGLQDAAVTPTLAVVLAQWLSIADAVNAVSGSLGSGDVHPFELALTRDDEALVRPRPQGL